MDRCDAQKNCRVPPPKREPIHCGGRGKWWFVRMRCLHFCSCCVSPDPKSYPSVLPFLASECLRLKRIRVLYIHRYRRDTRTHRQGESICTPTHTHTNTQPRAHRDTSVFHPTESSNSRPPVYVCWGRQWGDDEHTSTPQKILGSKNLHGAGDAGRLMAYERDSRVPRVPASSHALPYSKSSPFTRASTLSLHMMFRVSGGAHSRVT